MTAPGLVTDADLAERLGIDLDKLHELRRAKKWPHVRLGRFTFRFTEEQIAEIVASHSFTPGKSDAQAPSVPGQTARSASRRRAL